MGISPDSTAGCGGYLPQLFTDDGLNRTAFNDLDMLFRLRVARERATGDPALILCYCEPPTDCYIKVTISKD